MRSDTLMPLKQFTDWWGLDPWYVNGIDYDGSATGPSALRTDPKDRCDCMVQHPWDSPARWSRDDLIEMIRLAELVFVNEANFYPAPYFIENELRSYPHKNAISHSVLKAGGKPKTVKSHHPCYLQGYGAYSLTLHDTVTLDRSDLDEFTVTFAVPAGTTASDIRVYFTMADGGYSNTPGFNDHLFEIRPLEITVNGLNATVTGGAYMFKLPEFDETDECIPHELDSYAEDVAIYLITTDECSQGNFICFADNCQYVPCEPVRYPLCMSVKTVGMQKWGMPYPAQCDEEDNLSTYCLSCLPDEIEYSYVNGVPNDSGNAMEYKYATVLSKLAVGLADCIKEWCDCLTCPDKKVKYYREVPHALISLDKDKSQYDVGWQVVLSKATIQMLAGLPPYNGILQALRFINSEKCITTEGATYV